MLATEITPTLKRDLVLQISPFSVPAPKTPSKLPKPLLPSSTPLASFLSAPLSDFSPCTYQTKPKKANATLTLYTCHFQMKMVSIHTEIITLTPSNTSSLHTDC